MILLVLLSLMVFMPLASCSSTPPPSAPEPTFEAADSTAQDPQQAAMIELDAAMALAAKSREKALEVQGPMYFPDDWEKAEAQLEAGDKIEKDTLAGKNQAIGAYISAAKSYDIIAENSAPLFARDQSEGRLPLEAAMARAEKSRKEAQDNKGPEYFPDDWEVAENVRQSGEDAKKDSLAELKAATALYTDAADKYDDITARSAPLFAQEKEDSQKTAQQLAKEKDDAQKALNAATARAEKSRQQALAVNGQGYFPKDWDNAEGKNTSGKNAAKSTVDEIKAATELFVSAADTYDDIAKKSGPMFTKEKDDATKALQAAVARTEQSRKQASDAKGQTNVPNDWKNAEAKNQAAKNAKKTTIAEMKAAVPLYTAAATAYDDVTRKSNEMAVQTAKARADKERKAAMDVKANIVVKDDFTKADAVYQQAAKDSSAKSYASAANRYNQSADQFIAAARAAEGKRSLAEDTIEKAKQKSAESAAFARDTGLSMEGNDETI